MQVQMQAQTLKNSLSRPTRMMPFMLSRMYSTACVSVSRSIVHFRKVACPGMVTGYSFRQPLKFRKEAGKGLLFMGCEMPCQHLRHRQQRQRRGLIARAERLWLRQHMCPSHDECLVIQPGELLENELVSDAKHPHRPHIVGCLPSLRIPPPWLRRLLLTTLNN